MAIIGIVWTPLTKTQVVQVCNHIRVNKLQICFTIESTISWFLLWELTKKRFKVLFENNAEQLQDPNTGET